MPGQHRRVSFRLYLITDRKLCEPRGGLLAACEAALKAASEIGHGAEVAIQLREKDLSGRELYQLAAGLGKICARFGALLIVNDRIDVAIACGADGVHLPVDSFAIADARKLVGPSMLIGVSTHVAGEVAAAASGGADFAVFGPVYAPHSKATTMPRRGLAALRAACRSAAAMPLFALGGISAERVRALGADPGGGRPAGVAVVGAVFGADSPARATRSLLFAIERGLIAQP